MAALEPLAVSFHRPKVPHWRFQGLLSQAQGLPFEVPGVLRIHQPVVTQVYIVIHMHTPHTTAVEIKL